MEKHPSAARKHDGVGKLAHQLDVIKITNLKEAMGLVATLVLSLLVIIFVHISPRLIFWTHSLDVAPSSGLKK